MFGIFLDLETSGLDPRKHNLLEAAFRILDLNTGELVRTYQSVIYQPPEIWKKSDPESLEVNGFTWDAVEKGKKQEVVAQEITDIFKEVGIERGKAVYICQNPSFDRAFFTHMIDIYTQESLNWPYHWLDFASMYWALRIQGLIPGEPKTESICLSKNSIARECDLPCEPHPHKAINGVDHLIMLYKNIVGLPKA